MVNAVDNVPKVLTHPERSNDDIKIILSIKKPLASKTLVVI
jgi:hypothetical protein